MPSQWILSGTERTVAPGYEKDPTVAISDSISVTFWLRAKSNTVRDAARKLMAQPIRERQYRSIEGTASQFGPDPETAEAILKFAQTHDLTVTDRNEGSRAITMIVLASQVEDLFGVALAEYTKPGYPSYRGREDPISLSEADFTHEQANNICGVFGLDNRPQARRFASPIDAADLAFAPMGNGSGAQAAGAAPADIASGGPAAPPTSSNVPAQFPPPSYGFPVNPASAPGQLPHVVQNLTGAGQRVGVIGFGGSLPGNFFSQMDPTGRITVAPPQNITQPDAKFVDESKMDVEIIFNCAPGAEITLFAFDETEQGWITGLNNMLQSRSIPDVLSISWGWPEVDPNPPSPMDWTHAAIDAVEDLFASLALRGVTIVVSSGDLGSLVHYPGSSEFVLSCGGTVISPAPAPEKVWIAPKNASGGGVSTLILKPRWQSSAIQCAGPGNVLLPSSNRCIPDVAASALFSSAMLPRSTSGIQPLNGTSISAPQWAALVALANEALAKAGMPSASHVNAYLYDTTTSLQLNLNDIVKGGNDLGSGLSYIARPDWDACTGWGTPHVLPFISALVACSSRPPVIP